MQSFRKVEKLTRERKATDTPRFIYHPSSFLQRIFTSLGGKNRLASSKIVIVHYQTWLRWVLVLFLVLISILFTPQLLPQWVGFKWSTTDDFCVDRLSKLSKLERKMFQLARLDDGKLFVQRANNSLMCMKDDALATWNGPPQRVLFPQECTPENAKATVSEREVCVGGEKIEECVSFLGINLQCAEVTTPRKCSKIIASNPGEVQRIAELNVWHKKQLQNTTKQDLNETKEIAETADKAGEELIKRMLVQVDIASNLFTIYNIIALVVGAPLVIFQRERSTRVVGSLLGLHRTQFIVIVVIGLTIFDAAAKVRLDTNFSRILTNFHNDPCYLDPKFSKARLQLIEYTCGNVSRQRVELDKIYQDMALASHIAQLCEVSVVGNRTQYANASLVRNMELERNMYANGTSKRHRYPGQCNATFLNEKTSTPPNNGVSWFEAFFGSGILAQLILKGVISSFLINFIGFIEPMSLHNGMVEIFGLEKHADEVGLTENETASVRMYARDKRLMPLILASMAMLFEIAIIIYSISIQGYRRKLGIIQQLKLDRDPVGIAYYCNEGRLIDTR